MRTSERSRTFAATFFAFAGIGVLETAYFAVRGRGFAAAHLAPIIAIEIAACVALGLALASIARRFASNAAGGIALAVGAWCALRLGRELPAGDGGFGVRAAALAGVLGFAVVGASAARAAARRVPRLADARAWLAVCGLGSAAIVFALVRLGADALAAPAASPAGRPSILLVTIDTLRADYLGCYGRAQARTPVLDALAASGCRFEHAQAHTILTGPSHATILSGLLPLHHEVVGNGNPLDRGVPILADLLATAGYRTGAFVSGYPLQQKAARLLDRFDAWDDDFRASRALPRELGRSTLGAWIMAAAGPDATGNPHRRDARAVTEVATRWLADSAEAPYFAWVHYFDPHLPYDPPRELLTEAARNYDGPATGEWYALSADARRRLIEDPQAVAQMNALYDAEVACVDAQLGRLLAAAERSAGPGGLWVVVTADHGESFGEHDVFFSRDLYEPSLHVPLIVRAPGGGAARAVPDPVGLIDVCPTILDAAGVLANWHGDGVSLLGLTRGEAQPPRPQVAQIFRSPDSGFRRPLWALRDGGWKLIVRERGWNDTEHKWMSRDATALFDLEHDPGEATDLAGAQSRRADELKARGAGLHGEVDAKPNALDKEALDHLHALGYTQ